MIAPANCPRNLNRHHYFALGLATIAFVCWLQPTLLHAQWATSGNNVYTTNSAASVGIGISSPADILDVT
jgi:hypothetical protein